MVCAPLLIIVQEKELTYVYKFLGGIQIGDLTKKEANSSVTR